MSKLSLDTSEIAEGLRSRLPDCTGAVLVGSALTRSSDCVADIDITAFDRTVALGHDRHSSFEYHGLPVHVVAYSEWHFQAVACNDLLTLAYIREIRKILRGVVLFDDTGSVETSLRRLRGCGVAAHLLQPLAAIAATGAALPEDPAESRLAFYRAVESMTFAWLHLRLEYSYSKPKWLLEDVRTTRSASLEQLLYTLASELPESHDVGELVETAFRELPRGEGESTTQLLNNLTDARSLVSADRLHEAVFPLRMAVYQASELWAHHLSMKYADLRDITCLLPGLAEARPALGKIIDDTLLLRKPLPLTLRDLWQQAYSEFHRQWQCLTA
ncbi:hypothetical protein [Sinosporangium siamense]|uniref:Uncharacterized protein n=1 Tax=Sinosporangium siamense TaxID=1367973 RepID=A0A919V2P1_9ACTN|nr:hypothetical protein [Sinosporangium siamense]GII90135.1 hypothetical protein Ssi02_03660 [Sinosporangium siamense]